jgi:hypothetical protein
MEILNCTRSRFVCFLLSWLFVLTFFFFFFGQSLEAAFGALDEEARALLIGVLQMSEEQLNNLAPAEKTEALSLRQKAQELILANQKQ